MYNDQNKEIVKLKKIIAGRVPIPNFISQNISLKDKNWFKTGGPAKFFCQPTTVEEFQEALSFARLHDLPIFILGHGANILISDNGFQGLVIRPNLNNIKILKTDNNIDINDASTPLTVFVQADSGVAFSSLIDWCLEQNLIGLEEFSGIPGTVGGAVFINIHYFEFLLSHFLVSAQVIERNTGVIKTVDKNWFKFGYNHSELHFENYFLINAIFKLKKVDNLTTSFAKGRQKEIIRHREKRYPTSGTCGSFFRNFFEHEVTLTSLGKKGTCPGIIFVAYYLDKIGVKGTLSVNDAVVSYQHANMIVNKLNATSNDIVTLARKMQELVFEKFQIIPQPECRLIGFSEYPLLKQ